MLLQVLYRDQAGQTPFVVHYRQLLDLVAVELLLSAINVRIPDFDERLRCHYVSHFQAHVSAEAHISTCQNTDELLLTGDYG